MTETPPEHSANGAVDDRRLHVSLDIFDGPLDLLLHLVRERELDIATVSLASVAQQYFDYIAVMDALDVELAAEYLVIAATLVFLKSRSLLPPVPPEFQTEGEETAEEIEERLRRRLITYSKYKDVAQELRASQDEAASYFYRDAGDPATKLIQRYRVPSERLAIALLAAVRNARPVKRTIAREKFSIARQMEFVLYAVRERGRIEFRALCHDFDRSGVIATFLAILELIRQGRVTYEQDAPGDELQLIAPSLVPESYAS